MIVLSSLVNTNMGILLINPNNQFMENTNNNLENTWNQSPGRLSYYLSNGKWHFSKHLAFIDNKLVELCNRKINKLIINLPPRHGKSELISKYFPFWYLGNNPSHRIILTSYNLNLAKAFGRKIKDLISEYGETLYSIKLSNNIKSASNFELANFGGGLDCVGAAGSLTGKGADLLIIDDPIKNDKEANSITYRDNIWEWFRATAYTRLEPNGIIIIVMTRWNEDDLCGRIMKNIGNQDLIDDYINEWDTISLPAIAETNDLLGRNSGEALWEERIPLKKLITIRNQIGNYWFSSLYQQQPALSGDFIFKRRYFKYYKIENGIYKLYPNNDSKYIKTILPENCNIFATTDLAATSKNSSDYTVVLIFSITQKNDILVLDILRERMEGADHLNLLKSVYMKWRPVLIGVESTQYQISLIQNGIREGLPLKALRADKDKISRALPIAAKMEAGTVYFPDNTFWLNDFENEILAFPKGKYDDQVDAFAYISYLIEPFSYCFPAASRTIMKNKNNATKGF